MAASTTKPITTNNTTQHNRSTPVSAHHIIAHARAPIGHPREAAQATPAKQPNHTTPPRSTPAGTQRAPSDSKPSTHPAHNRQHTSNQLKSAGTRRTPKDLNANESRNAHHAHQLNHNKPQRTSTVQRDTQGASHEDDAGNAIRTTSGKPIHHQHDATGTRRTINGSNASNTLTSRQSYHNILHNTSITQTQHTAAGTQRARSGHPSQANTSETQQRAPSWHPRRTHDATHSNQATQANTTRIETTCTQRERNDSNANASTSSPRTPQRNSKHLAPSGRPGNTH